MTATATEVPQGPPAPRSGPRAAITARTLRTDRWWAEPGDHRDGPAELRRVLDLGGVPERQLLRAGPTSPPSTHPALHRSAATPGRARRSSTRRWLGWSARGGPSLRRSSCSSCRLVSGSPATTTARPTTARSGGRPAACAVKEPHKAYRGESRLPLILQNVHRYFFYLGLVLNCILTWDAIEAFHFANGWGMGLGTVVLVVNATLLWFYSLSCHSCRHIVGGRLKHFSRHPVRFKLWGFVSKLNARHMQIAWVSLVFVALTDLYVRLVASGWVHDPRFF